MRNLQGSSSLEAAGDIDLQEVEWNPESVLQVRKLWEVRPGDRIIMRTTIGLDGDVTTHIDPTFTGSDYKFLHEDMPAGLCEGEEGTCLLCLRKFYVRRATVSTPCKI